MENYWQRLGTRRYGRRTVLAAAGGAGALALAGCGDDDDEDKPSGGGGQPTAGGGGSTPAATATPANFLASIPLHPPDPTPVAQFKAGGTINRLIDRPLQLDHPGGGGSNVGECIGNVYSRLIRYSNRASLKSTVVPEIEGDMATAWEQPDATTLIFTLAPGIKFQNVPPLNGRALTIDDIKYTFDRGKVHPRSTTTNKADYNRFKSVEDVGGGKVRLTLNAPFAPIQSVLASNVFIIQPPEVAPMDAIATTAVGSGPFIIQKFTPNVEIVYRKNPDFFKKDSAGKQLPYLDGYTLSFVADPGTRLAQVEAGKADSSYQPTSNNVVTYDNVEDLNKRYPGKFVFQAIGQPAPFYYISGHHNKAPWNDPRVRRAFNKLLDRDTMSKQLAKGFTHTGPFFPWQTVFDTEPKLSDLGPNYKYDLREAKQMLTAAGVPANLELSLEWYEGAANAAITQVFQQAAAEVGVKINLIKNADLVTQVTRNSQKSWQDLTLILRAISYSAVEAAESGFLTGHPANSSDVSDPEMDNLYTQYKAASGAARRPLAKQMWDRALDQVYDLPLPQIYDLTWWTSRLHNWRNTSSLGNVGTGNHEHVWVSS